MYWSQTESSKCSLDCLSRDRASPVLYTRSNFWVAPRKGWSTRPNSGPAVSALGVFEAVSPPSLGLPVHTHHRKGGWGRTTVPSVGTTRWTRRGDAPRRTTRWQSPRHECRRDARYVPTMGCRTTLRPSPRHECRCIQGVRFNVKLVLDQILEID